MMIQVPYDYLNDHVMICFVCLLQGASMIDGSAILKPALSRGSLRCIAASSLDKFKKTIERDPGLERRFQQVGIVHACSPHVYV